jgi:hypothetical protein
VLSAQVYYKLPPRGFLFLSYSRSSLLCVEAMVMSLQIKFQCSLGVGVCGCSVPPHHTPCPPKQSPSLALVAGPDCVGLITGQSRHSFTAVTFAVTEPHFLSTISQESPLCFPSPLPFQLFIHISACLENRFSIISQSSPHQSDFALSPIHAPSTASTR